MKKLFPIIALFLLLVTTPVLASKNNGEKEEIKINQQLTTVCDPEDDWKNHGAYVSCVAKLHLGGQKTSEAAKSDIGKKEDRDEDDGASPSPSASPSASPSVSPSASPSASPSGSPTASPSASPSGSPSGSPSASPSASPAAGINIELNALIEVLKNILQSLKKLV